MDKISIKPTRTFTIRTLETSNIDRVSSFCLILIQRSRGVSLLFRYLGNTHVVPLPVPVKPHLSDRNIRTTRRTEPSDLGRVVGGDLHFRYFYQLVATEAGYAGERPGRGPQSGLVET